MTRSYKIGTFYHPKKGFPPTRSRVSTYTLWYNPKWDGCIEYAVSAENSAEARKLAIDQRLRHEIEKLKGDAV